MNDANSEGGDRILNWRLNPFAHRSKPTEEQTFDDISRAYAVAIFPEMGKYLKNKAHMW